MTSSTPTLSESLGAGGGIGKAVDDFYSRVVADPELAEYFDGADMVSLRRHQRDMLVAALSPLRSAIVSA